MIKKQPRTTGARGAIDWRARLPDMSDEGLANLLSNAQRLSAASRPGADAEAAAELVPAIEAEQAERRARRATGARKPARNRQEPRLVPARSPSEK